MNVAVYFMAINLTLPIFQLQKKVFCVLTGRTFRVGSLFIIDLLCALSVLGLMIKFIRVSSEVNTGFGMMGDKPTTDVMFM